MAAEPGIGAPLSEAASIISGIGDVLHVFAVCIERLGLDHGELRELLDLLIEQLEDAGERERAIPPKALRAVLQDRAEFPVRRFRVLEGGRSDPPNAGARS